MYFQKAMLDVVTIRTQVDTKASLTTHNSASKGLDIRC